MGRDEERTLAALRAHRHDLIDPKAAQYGGRTVKLMGDGILMEFPSVVEAMTFAIEVQCALRERNAALAEEDQIEYRIGINVGDIIAEDGDIFGDGVNLAARLEALADPGGICVRRNVRNQVRDRLDINFEDLGEIDVKNIERPVRVFRVTLDSKADALVTPVRQITAPSDRRRWMPIAAGIAAITAIVLAVWQPWAPDIAPARAEHMAFPLPNNPSIAILPFDNLSDGEGTDYLSDGITEDIIATVSRIPDLFVVARNATTRYKRAPVETRQVAEELGVRFVLEGSVRAQDGQVRVTAQLIDATAGNYVWSERYDRSLNDVLSLQEEIALRVANALYDKVTGLRGLEARTNRLMTGSLEAWELNIRAITIYRNLTRENVLEARKLWTRAVGIDPDYAQAWARLALTHLVEVRIGWSDDPKRSSSLARDYAEKALALDPDELAGHSVIAFLSLYARKHDEAINAARRAIAIDPNNTAAMYSLADILRYSGDSDAAVQLIREVMRRNPDYPDWYLYGLAASLYLSEQYEDSIIAYSKLIERTPGYNWAHSGLAMNYVALGRMEDARREAELEIKVNPDISLDWVRRVVPYRNPEDTAAVTEPLARAGIPD